MERRKHLVLVAAVMAAFLLGSVGGLTDGHESEPREETAMKCNVVDMKNHRYFENKNSRHHDERRYVFEIPEDKLGVIAKGALVISLESFGFNGGNLAWYGEYMGEFVWNKDEERMELVGPHAEFDEHLGWY